MNNDKCGGASGSRQLKFRQFKINTGYYGLSEICDKKGKFTTKGDLVSIGQPSFCGVFHTVGTLVGPRRGLSVSDWIGIGTLIGCSA